MTPVNSAAFLHELESLFGAGVVTPGAEVPARYFTDWSGLAPTRPLALVRPRSTADVSAVLELCHRYGVPVVPQGGLTGLAGAAVPLANGLALSLERMNSIESVDAGALTLIAQAGVTLQALHEAAATHGRVFGVDLGARGSCQLGGMVSTNAGGNGVVQFGMMREQVLGLEVVLADGSVLAMLRPMIKNNTGYDLKHFFIGAEGTLGVITRVLLRLHPAPAARVTALVALPDFDASLVLLSALQEHFPGAVAAYELMWRDFVEASVRWQGLREPFEHPPALCALVDLTGTDDTALVAALEDLVGALVTRGTVLDGVLARSGAQARALWKIREATAELPSRMRPPINFDVGLPVREIGRFALACRAALDARWPAHHTVFFGHIGDGNLHVSTDAASVCGDVAGVEAVVNELVGTFNGSVSAEHGIGLHRRRWLGVSRTPAEIDAMRAIRRALDPRGLMNPGKIFGEG